MCSSDLTATDLDRLRYVLMAQRDQYLPLKVIKENLDAMDRGLTPGNGVSAPTPRLGVISTESDISAASFAESSELRLSRDELLKASGLKDDQLVELESFGLITLQGRYYDNDALAVAKVVTELSSFGIEGRHLRSFKSASDREIGLIEQVITPLTRQRSIEAKARAEEVQRELASLSVRLHAALVRSGLNRLR